MLWLIEWVELLRNRSNPHDGFRIAREDGRKRPFELNPSYEQKSPARFPARAQFLSFYLPSTTIRAIWQEESCDGARVRETINQSVAPFSVVIVRERGRS